MKQYPWKKLLLPAALVLTLALPGAMYAADAAAIGTQAPTVSDKSAMDGFHKQGMGSHMGGKQMGKHRGDGKMGENRGDGKMGGAMGFHGGKANEHQQMYMSLLTEKYAPEYTAEWQAANDERDKLNEQLQALREQQKTAMEAKRDELQQQRKELMKKLTSGEITREQFNEQVKALLGTLKGKAAPFAEPDAAEHELRHALQVEFTAAVKAVDSEAIKAVVPKLLEQAKADNARLAEHLAQLQKALADNQG